MRVERWSLWEPPQFQHGLARAIHDERHAILVISGAADDLETEVISVPLAHCYGGRHAYADVFDSHFVMLLTEAPIQVCREPREHVG